MQQMKIAVLAGDGIGNDIMPQAIKVLKKLEQQTNTNLFEFNYSLVGGAAIDKCGEPLPQQTLDIVKNSQAILFGATGVWKYDILERHLRPEQAFFYLRKNYDLFINLRPIKVYPCLMHTSPLKAEILKDVDLLIIRELTGDVYFGQPRGIRIAPDGNFKGAKEGFDTMRYSEPEVKRIAEIAFQYAENRRGKLCSVDKANVLESSELWREVITHTALQYPQIKLEHLYIDNAAMQLIKRPSSFDVIVTGNLFGDILSDEAAVLSGSLGMLPSASINANGFGLYEPCHGSAPDIAGKNKANPIAMILSSAMMLRYTFKQEELANSIEQAVEKTLNEGYRTADIYYALEHEKLVGTNEMGDIITQNLICNNYSNINLDTSFATI